MKIKELIKILNTKDPETRIAVQGYEQGYSDIGSLKDVAVRLNVNSEEYNGPHEQSEDGEPHDEVAVVIFRQDNPLSK